MTVVKAVEASGATTRYAKHILVKQTTNTNEAHVIDEIHRLQAGDTTSSSKGGKQCQQFAPVCIVGLLAAGGSMSFAKSQWKT